MNGHIEKVGNSYRITYEHPKVNGRRVRTNETVRGSKREAERVMRQKIAEYEKTLDQGKKAILTVSELYQLFRESKEGKLKYKSMKFYDDNFNVNVIPYIGNLKIHELTPLRIEQLYDEVAEPRAKEQKVYTLSKNSIHAIHRSLRAVFNWAYKKQIITKNVMDHVDSPPTEKNEVEYLTYNEMTKLLADNREAYHINAIATACFTGMRISEILGLTWADIDMGARLISVKAQISNIPFQEPELIATKTESSVRLVPIIKHLVPYLEQQYEYLAELKAQLGDDYECQYVFFGLDSEPWHPSSVNHSFKRMVRAMGRPNVRLHGLRHSFITWFLEMGFDVAEVQKIVGHIDAQMITKIYQHVNVERVQDKLKSHGLS